VSLIDDALKRAQAADAAAGRSSERPWIPTPMPDAGLARRRRILRALAIGIAVAAVLVAGAWVLRRAASAPAAPTAASTAASEAPRPAPVRTETPLQIVVVVPTPTTPVPAAGSPEPVRVRPTRAPRPTAAPAPAGEGGEGASAEAAPPPPTPAPRPSGPLADGRTYAGSLTLPNGNRIELGGIVWSETEPRALLNDRILAVGSYVEGFVVAGIEENRVALEKDGVRIYVTVR